MKMDASNASVAIEVSHTDRSSRIGMAIWTVLTLALIAAPWWSDRSSLRLLTEIYSYICLASLWNLLAGYAGLVSVGQQAFVGLGGYVLYACALGLHVNPVWGVPSALVVSAALAVPIALVLFRLRGAYFAIGSWVVAEVFMQTAELGPSIAGIDANLSLPAAVVKTVAANRDTREHLIYWLFLGLLIFTIGVIVALLRSRYGLALTAIRDNEVAAQANGVDVNRTRLTVFVVASAATGATGALIFLQKLSHHADLGLRDERLDDQCDLHDGHRRHRSRRGADRRRAGVLRAASVARRRRQHLFDPARRGRHRRDAEGEKGPLGLFRRPVRLAAFPARAAADLPRRAAIRPVARPARGGLTAPLSPGHAFRLCCRRKGRQAGMQSRLLRYFLATVERKNITTAAEDLHITQPALTRSAFICSRRRSAPPCSNACRPASRSHRRAKSSRAAPA